MVFGGWQAHVQKHQRIGISIALEDFLLGRVAIVHHVCEQILVRAGLKYFFQALDIRITNQRMVVNDEYSGLCH